MLVTKSTLAAGLLNGFGDAGICFSAILFIYLRLGFSTPNYLLGCAPPADPNSE